MSLLAKALLIVVMNQGNGNMAIGSESVTVTESIVECKQSQQVFLKSKSKVEDVVFYGNQLTFTKVTPTFEQNIKYTLTCNEMVGE